MPLNHFETATVSEPSKPLTAEEVAAGLLRMAAFLDCDAAARKVAMDFALSLPHPERNDDNG